MQTNSNLLGFLTGAGSNSASQLHALLNNKEECDRIRALPTGYTVDKIHDIINVLAAKEGQLTRSEVRIFCAQLFGALTMPIEFQPWMVPMVEAQDANALFVETTVAHEIQGAMPTKITNFVLHGMLDHVVIGVPMFTSSNLSAQALVKLADRFVASVLKLSAGLTFFYLRNMLAQIESEMSASRARPALAPLNLEGVLTDSEQSMLAMAYDQHPPLTINGLRLVIDRTEHQIEAVPNSTSAIRTLLAMMESVARDMAEEDRTKAHQR